MSDSDAAVVVLEQAYAFAVLHGQAAVVLAEIDGTPVVTMVDVSPVVQSVQQPTQVQSALEQPASVLAAGDQGPQGPPGQSGSSVEYPFSFGDASPVLLGSFAGVVLSISIVILLPFDGIGSQLDVRTDANEVLAPASNNLPSEIGRYETNPGVRLNAPTPLFLNINPGIGTTTGAGAVYMEILQ